MQYFLYTRKSTDVEDKQVLSIEAQLSELRMLAKQQNLEIVHEFVEKQSAKIPNRPIFNEMMARIQKGEAHGIVCWKIDRLARNPVDGGQIQWLLQNGTIQHIQTHDRAYYPADNVLMMSMEFGMANQFIRDLSANTARGLRAKARQGHFPGTAPVGYLNDPRTKTIVVNRKKSKVIRAVFDLYAKGNSRLEDVSTFLFDNGVKSLHDNPIHKDRAKFILTNPFYYGHFRYGGEWYEGRHTPLIDKQLFNKVQKVLRERGHPQTSTTAPQALCGLLSCGECKMSITAEVRTKTQKNGNVHRYVYYRCTKKGIHCSQSYVREEILAEQLSEKITSFALPEAWRKEMFAVADKDEKDSGASAHIAVQELRTKAEEADRKLARLTDLYIDQDIERDAYLVRRRALTDEKCTLGDQIALLESGAKSWLEPLRNWIQEASELDEIGNSTALPAKKSALQKIFGSNLFLHNQKILGTASPLYATLRVARKNSENEGEIQLLAAGPGLEPR
ncbi:MAG: recombinase family protein [Candidatus Paceibacterota bacterium]